MMNKRVWMVLSASLLLLSGAALYTYQRYSAGGASVRGDVLAMMPSNASAVVFVDLAELRAAPFLAQLYAWAPQPEPDEDYARFLTETGFHYERDLDHLAIAFEKDGQDSTFFAVAEGRFDRQRISALAIKSGSVEKRGGREIFAVPEDHGASKIYFTFLSNERIALANRANLAATLSAKKRTLDHAEWHTRFERLAGSPVFAVIRQDAAPGQALSSQAPGGFLSPQLSTMLDQLQWITLAGKPESDRLRVVAEGECSSEETARRLADLLNGVLTLAGAGLNDAKARRQLDPALREAYLALLKGFDISKIDRGDTKSVRLVFEITPAFLELARRSSTGSPEVAPAKPAPGNTSKAKKGHI
jgi:hypothetical protein